MFYHYLQVVILGIVEGVTEFLPISSTGHLLIAEHFLGVQEPDIFNVVIQAGAILAVVFIYWQKITDLLASLQDASSRNFLMKIGLSFFVTMAVYLVVSHIIGHHKLTESLGNVAWATLIGGIVIFILEFVAKRLYAHEGVSWMQAIVVGLAQVLAAIFPGTSRSGASIMSGMAVGMKRPVVTEFSFLVGIPTMFAASVYASFKSYKAGELNALGHQIIIDTAVGFVVSMIVAFFVVKWLLRFVQSHTFNGFAIYRVLLGGALLIALSMHAIPDVGKEEKPEVTKEVPATVPEVSPVPNATMTPVQPLAPATNPPPVTPAVPLTNGESSPVVPAPMVQ